MSNAITITFEVPGKTEEEVVAFVAHVLANDLLLRGRDRGAAPEGAGSWAHLLHDWCGMSVKDANALVPFIRVLASTTKATTKAPAKATTKAPAKGRKRTAKAPAPAPADAPDLAALTAQLATMQAALASLTA